MLVEQMMTKHVFTCSPADRMSTAARLMWEHDCGCVPVVEDELGVIGMITDRDVCMAALIQDAPLTEILVASAMSRDVCVCHHDDPVAIAEETMRGRQVRRLPVVDDANRILGLLSLNDIARAAASGWTTEGGSTPKEEIADTLAMIGEHRVLATVPA